MSCQRDTLSARVDQLSCSVKELADTLRNLIVDTNNNSNNTEGNNTASGESGGTGDSYGGDGNGDGMSPIMGSSGVAASKGPQIVRTNTIKGGGRTAKATAIGTNGPQSKVVVANISTSTVDIIPPHK